MSTKVKVCIVSLIAVVSLVTINYMSNNGIIVELLYITLPGETIYSEHFDKNKFKNVKIGDSYNSVIASLKDPISTYEYSANDGTQVQVLEYTKSGPSSGHYRQRMIFIKSGKVIRKASEIFID